MVVSSTNNAFRVLPLLLLGCTGCLGDGDWAAKLQFWNHEPVVDHAATADSFVLRDGQVVDVGVVPTVGGDYDAALQLFEKKEYAQAEPIFRKIADNSKNMPKVCESARWWQAECFYNQGQYPDAAERYMQLLNTFPSAEHGEPARKKLFDIANYWLDETRDQMEQAREVREGKRWFTTPILPVHWEDSKPLLDIEGHALRLLETVHLTNPRGPLGDKALFYLGSVKFYRESYRDADHYFYQLVQFYPNSPHAPKALELSIICKQICVGGPHYDGRKLQEARDLITKARNGYGGLSHGNEQFLTKQLVQIHLMQAEKDYDTAKLYERIGHPGSAYFCYEIVKRRYPGTPFADKAEQRMVELKAKAEKERERHPAAEQPNDLPPQLRGPGPGDERGPPPRALPPGMLEGPPR